MKSTIKLLLGSLVFFTLAVLTLTGHVAQVIPFAGTSNELGFFMVNGVMGILFFIAAFTPDQKPKPSKF